MKRISFIITFIIALLSPAFSQDIINPYILRDGNLNELSIHLKPKEPISLFEFDTTLPFVSNSGGYDGEYMISLKYHPWHGSTENSISYFYGFENFAKSYSIEVVSFPFMMNCFDAIDQCAAPISSPPFERNLETPDYLHAYNGSGWGNLSQYHLSGTFRYSDGMSAQDAGQCPDLLVSRSFNLDATMPPTGCRTILPHSILKHTVYLHCGTAINYPVVSSFSWYYDNTRGIMRCYPFYSDNYTASNDVLHDVMFAPMVIEDNTYQDPSGASYYVNRYDRFDNYNAMTGGIIEGGTIDYFPHSDIIGCAEFPVPSYSIGEFSLVDNLEPYPYFDHLHPFPSQYLLLNSFLRNSRGKTLAGYDAGLTSISPIISQNNRINHNYYITHDFDGVNDRIIHLNIINPTEKIIFNPSEVTLDPDGWNSSSNSLPIEVIFPEGYTFKTILGRYPSKQQVLDADNDPQNGGPYSDLRDVPVPVDAATRPWTTSNAIDYPEVMWDDPTSVDPNGFRDDERFGYYYIEDKAILTIENCVRLFDARFEVNPGGIMRFDDYPGILGYEDKSSNLGRYKIRGEGGAILRNYALVQYVQNGDIFQTTQLNYIASSHIIAGKNVDPDTDQPDGIYEIKAGANVTFTAGDYIHLTDGFYVSGGDFHAVIDENMSVPVSCNANNQQNGGNRVQQQPTALKPRLSNNITVSPNPSIGQFDITMSGDGEMNSVSVFDLVGRRVYYSTNINEKSHLINLHTQIKGPIIVEVINNADEIKRVKIIVE